MDKQGGISFKKGGSAMNITQKEIDNLARGLEILYNNLADKCGAYDQWAKPVWCGPAPAKEGGQDEQQREFSSDAVAENQ